MKQRIYILRNLQGEQIGTALWSSKQVKQIRKEYKKAGILILE